MRRYLLVGLWVIVGCSGGSDPATPGRDGGVDRDDGGVVADAPGSRDTVVLTIGDRPTDPDVRLLVAYRDGDGPWTLAPAPVGDDYTVPVVSERYSALITCRDHRKLVVLLHATVAETRHLTTSMRSCARDTPPVDQPVAISNLGAGESAAIDGFSIGSQNGAHTVSLSPHVQEVTASVTSASVPPARNPVRLRIARNVTIGAGVTLAFDLAPSATIATSFLDANLPPVPGEASQISSWLHTKTARHRLSDASVAPFPFAIIPAAQMDPTDIFAFIASSVRAGSLREQWQWRKNPAAATFEIPAPLVVSTTVTAQAPFVRLRTSWSPLPTPQLYSWFASQQIPATACEADTVCVRNWSALATAGWLAGTAAYEMPEPRDVAALSGWDAALQLVPGQSAVVGAVAYEASSGLDTLLRYDFLAVPHADGVVIDRSLGFGQLVP